VALHKKLKVKQANKYSKIQLSIFALTFIAIGGYFIISSFAASVPPTTLPGDTNGDGLVNITDLSTLLSHYSTNYPTADFNTDNVVNITDLSILLSNYGKSGGGTVSCTGAQHSPGGSDGAGGCWPGSNNTGPNAAESSMSVYTGSCTISAANTTIDSKVINCSPLLVGVGASGLLVKNSYVKGGIISEGTASFTIQDSLIDNAVHYNACSSPSTCASGNYACGDPNNATIDCGVGYKNFTILRTEIINTNRAAYCESTCTIQDSYFHGTNLWPDHTNLAHASSVRNEQYLTLRHNSLGCDYTGPFPNGELGCSADMSGYPDFAPIKNATIDNNLFLSNNAGAGFCVYGGGTAGKPFSSDPTNATYIVFKNNVFQRGANGKCGTYGPVTDFISGRTGNVWSNNNYDNGAAVSAN
jgi:hypothetical protein